MNNPLRSSLNARPNIELCYQGYRVYAALQGYMLVDNYPLWKNLYESIEGFEVYKDVTLKGFTTGNSFVVTGLLFFTNYSFTVNAMYNSNNFSTESTSLPVTTLSFTVVDGIKVRGKKL